MADLRRILAHWSVAGVAGLCAVSLNAGNAGAGESEESDLSGNLETLMATRFSKVGDVQRTYDKDGHLIQAIYPDSPTRGITETLTINEQTGLWLRRFEIGHTLIREEREQFGEGERLLSRQTVWSSKKDGKLDRRLVEKFVAVEVESHSYELVAGKWQEKESKKESTLVMGPSPAPVGQYAECLKDAGKAANSAKAQESCRKLLDGILNLDVTNYTAYANLECNDAKNSQIFLPEGFRIDTASCGNDPYVLQRMKSAITSMMGDMKCLAGLNPAVSKRLAAKIAEKRPRLNCLGGRLEMAEGSTLYKRLCGQLAGGAKDEACISKVLAMRDPKTGAFYNSATPNDVYLVTSDPRIGIARMAAEADRRARQLNDDHKLGYGFERDKWVNDEIERQKAESMKVPNDTLGGTMLHEFLHLAGIPHNEHPVKCNGKQTIVHNCYVDGEYQKDAVYGCPSLCSNDYSSKSHWTKEGCLACVTWNNKGADKTKCDVRPKSD
ncbi:MAG: hypothetical protein HY074_17250 [Deltaproteobacteria bacterium]|nr:hypothetical protein [Deltaproteobacteria bacterium]